MQKYLAHIKQALQQLTGDVALPMPAVTISSVAAACKDPDVIHTFEETVAEWSSTLSDVMQRESEKRPQGKGPLAEIDFWRARSAVLSGLWEQLSMRAAADIIEVVEAASDDRNLMAAFKAQLAELGKLVHEVGYGYHVTGWMLTLQEATAMTCSCTCTFAKLGTLLAHGTTSGLLPYCYRTGLHKPGSICLHRASCL
jgi:hypothetical protein